MTKAEAGARGGAKTVERYGSEHMSRIGKAGFAATREKHFNGCDAATLRFLQSIGARCLLAAKEVMDACKCPQCGEVEGHKTTINLSTDYIRQLEREGW